MTRYRRLFLTVSAVVLSTLTLGGAPALSSPGFAEVDDEQYISLIDVESSNYVGTSSLTLGFPDALSENEARNTAADLAGVNSVISIVGDALIVTDPTSTQPSSRTGSRHAQNSPRDFTKPGFNTTPAGEGTGARIHCNHPYYFPDSNGTFTIQRKCNGLTAPWGYKFNSHVVSICTGVVHEQGMGWWLNGDQRPRQAQHNAPCNYQWHGTFNPVVKGWEVRYYDAWTFQHNVDGGERLTCRSLGICTLWVPTVLESLR